MSKGDRLLSRPRLSAEHPIRIDDDTEARREVESARMLLQILEIQGDSADQAAVRKAKADLKRAEKKLRACYEWIRLRAMEADDFEALLGKHKPRPDTKDTIYNLDTFPKACLLACDESGRSEADWEHIWKSVLSGPERTELCNAAIRINARTPDESLPKGWAQTEPSG
ncbi:hypothetical protein [Nonomuraea angiospora]|uniref:hypothetical protein n=1 Tax=Nonomuraea angiospora TaxID=46172 RepID=UPI0029B5142E|nr:hypothetical protein [Nonomuraea angiospora]MDX3101759.1 hypothetical protein [Nonomuraea angiospora]